MANRPASAGAHSAGPRGGPPPVHHQDFPRTAARPSALAWLPYLIVLAGVVIGLVVAWLGTQAAGRGAGVAGGALLAAAVARLVLPPRYAGLLVSRRKALDVTAFAVLGAGLLGIAASLP